MLKELCVWVCHYEFIIFVCGFQFKIPFYKEFPSVATGAPLCRLLCPSDKIWYSLRASLNSGTNGSRFLLNSSLSRLALLFLQGALIPCMGIDAERLPSGGEGEKEKDQSHQQKSLQGLESVGGGEEGMMMFEANTEHTTPKITQIPGCLKSYPVTQNPELCKGLSYHSWFACTNIMSCTWQTCI